MGKYIYKLTPRSYWNIGEIESWLADMAREGLHLEWMRLVLTKFAKGNSRGMEYRIVSSPEVEITQEQKEKYLDMGWTYVTDYSSNFYVFSSPSAENVPEIYGDPAEQAGTLKDLKKVVIVFTSFVCFCTVLLVVMESKRPQPFLNFIEDMFIYPAIFQMLIAFVQVYEAIMSAISIHRIKKALSTKKAINHHAPWKRKRRNDLIKQGMIFNLILMMIASFFVLKPISDRKNLPIAGNNPPVVRLADIEKNPDMERYPSYREDAVEYGNSYSRKWSFMAPLQYETYEQGIVKNKVWKGRNELYSPNLESWTYKLTFSSMRDAIVADLMEKFSGSRFNYGYYIEMNHQGFDKLFIRKGDDFRDILAVKGKGIIYVKYSGYADLEDVIKAVEEKMKLIYK